jgi:O-antigen/teichoic acid export membrane protein
LLGYKLRGVFGGFSVAAVIALVWSYILLKKNISSSEKINVSDKYKKVLIVSLPVILMSLDLMLLGNIDSILVKKYFDPISAGYYAGVVTLGKIFLFGAGAVSTVMFPQIAALVAKKQSVKKAFTKFVLMQLALIVAGILAYNVFPDLITTVFFKDKFTHAIPYLPLFATFIGLYVFINFMALFFIAVEKFKIYLVMVPGVVLQFVLIALYHQTLTQIIMADIAGALLVLVCMIVYYFEGKIA